MGPGVEVGPTLSFIDYVGLSLSSRVALLLQDYLPLFPYYVSGYKD